MVSCLARCAWLCLGADPMWGQGCWSTPTRMNLMKPPQGPLTFFSHRQTREEEENEKKKREERRKKKK